jgi:hypothetical protein
MDITSYSGTGSASLYSSLSGIKNYASIASIQNDIDQSIANANKNIIPESFTSNADDIEDSYSCSSLTADLLDCLKNYDLTSMNVGEMGRLIGALSENEIISHETEWKLDAGLHDLRYQPGADGTETYDFNEFCNKVASYPSTSERTGREITDMLGKLDYLDDFRYSDLADFDLAFDAMDEET